MHAAIVDRAMQALLPVAIVFLAVPPQAEDDGPTRTLVVVNDAAGSVNQLFVSGGKAKGWRAKVSGIVGAPADESDRLDARMLPRGGSIAVELPGERCEYDVRAILESGRTYAGRVDVCATPRLALSALGR